MRKWFKSKVRTIKYWFQRRTRGWDDTELWNLDYEFIKWVNSRFKEYKKQTKIDLTFNKIKYKRKEYTQGELIDEIITISDRLLNEDFYYDTLWGTVSQEEYKLYDTLLHLFILVIRYMWW